MNGGVTDLDSLRGIRQDKMIVKQPDLPDTLLIISLAIHVLLCD